MLHRAEPAAAPVEPVRAVTTAAGLLSPVTIVALTVLVANDHWAKARFPGPATGKVSDLAGLLVFPWVLVGFVDAAGWVVGRRSPEPRRVLWWSVAATALGFAAVKASPDVAAWWSEGLGWVRWPARAVVAAVAGRPLPEVVPLVVRADRTDLLMLPAVIVPVFVSAEGASCCALGRC